MTATDIIVPIVVALLGGGGALATWVQARSSAKKGVREADVSAVKNSGDLALEIAEDLRDQVRRLETGRTEDRARITRLERENYTLRAKQDRYETSIRDAVDALSELMEWERAGAAPPPPHLLSTIIARLSRSTRKEE